MKMIWFRNQNSQIFFNSLVLALITAISLGMYFFIMTGPVMASQGNPSRSGACEGLEITGGGACENLPAECIDNPQLSQCQQESGSALSNVVQSGLNVFSAAVGIASVAMILFGGFKYITAGGDSSRIQSAQQTIIYAIVGLVIAGLAQIIVRFVVAVAS